MGTWLFNFGYFVFWKFNEFFKIEKLTILGDVSDSLREKVAPMNPEFRYYKAGFTSKFSKDRVKKMGGRYWNFFY